MKLNKDILLSLFIYLVSVGGLTLSDLIVVGSFSQENIAQWAFLKSVIFVLGGFCIFGFDQLLLREPSYYIEIKKQYWFQSILLSSICVFLLYLYLNSFVEALLLFFILIFYSYFLFEASYFRVKNKLLFSQLYTNLWKLILFIVLLIFVFLKINNGILAIYFSSISSAFLFLFLYYKIMLTNIKDESKSGVDNKKRISFLILGLYFFVHNVSLVMANYGEQFLINLFNNKELSSEVFTYITLYSSLALAALSFVGFYLGPKIRNDEKFNLKVYYKYFNYLIFFSFLVILFNSLLIVILKPIFFKGLKFDLILWSLTILMTFFRVLYILPSLCLGIFGSENNLMKSSIYTLLAVIVYVIFFALLLKFNINNLVYFVMFLILLHWVFKLIISNHFVHLSLKKSSSES